MNSHQKFKLVKKELSADVEDMRLYLLGYAMHGGEECLLVRAERDGAPLFDLYYPGGVEEVMPGALTRHGAEAERLYRKFSKQRKELSEMALDMDAELADAVLFADDLRLIRDGEVSMRYDQAFPLDHGRAANAIRSYEKIYDGEMYDFIRFSQGNHASISDMGNFGDGDIALIHVEDNQGSYRDILFPSMRVIGEAGGGEVMDRLLRHVYGSGPSLNRLIERRARNKREFLTDKAAYNSRCWHALYSDIQLAGDFSGIHHDASGDHVYVYCECCGGEDHEFIVRLPEGEIVKVRAFGDVEDFDPRSMKTAEIGAVIQRLVRDTDAIFALARKAAEPGCTEDDLNALRDGINGKIIRKIAEQCPYCHSTFPGEEEIIYTVNVPVRFCMEHDSFKVLEWELNQSVVEAVQSGGVTGECPYCRHKLTTEDIDRVKSGWQYRWRYDPNV